MGLQTLRRGVSIGLRTLPWWPSLWLNGWRAERRPASPAAGEPPCVVVCSLPKAGTYLCGAILGELGFRSSGLHAMEDIVTDYGAVSLDEARRSPEALTRRIPLPRLLTRLRPGDYMVSHLGCSWMTRQALSGFKVVALQRELRTSFVSHLRFLADTGRREGDAWRALPDGPARTHAALASFGATHLGMCRRVLGCFRRPGVLCLSYEELAGDCGHDRAVDAVLRLAEFCGSPVARTEAERILTNVIGRPTQTWSGRRTDLDRYWDAEAEAAFRRLGGAALNRRFGYALADWDGTAWPSPAGLPVRQGLVQRLVARLLAAREICRRPGVPWHARLVLGVAVGYFLSPIDLIPDWIPVVGYLDDALVVQLLLALFFVLVRPPASPAAGE